MRRSNGETEEVGFLLKFLPLSMGAKRKFSWGLRRFLRRGHPLDGDHLLLAERCILIRVPVLFDPAIGV